MSERSQSLPAADLAGFDRPTAAASAFPVAAWFLARAAAEQLTLQPLKLQALLFLAQGLFAAGTGGRQLMPALFVADERAPIEPNVHLVLASGFDAAGAIEASLSAAVERFLEVVWAQFGRRPAVELVMQVSGLKAYTDALACGVGTPIGQNAIRECCVALAPAAGEQGAGKPLRTQDGRLVTVSRWQPAPRPPSPSTPAAKPQR